ncbi:MAG: retron St85 family RNA-directed DNA polymerase [Alcanivoracaceae bacterium]|nr:retron St85 family RNA-directed DNA polymerase [Alcanivoracaceae bacterium]
MNIVGKTALALGMSEARLLSFISTCPRRYKRYNIPKRNGDGQRLICQPSKELKFLQGMVLEKFLLDLPLHRAATAYREGMGIKENASRHKDSRYFLKMDFRNFFPSIKPEILTAHIEKFRQVKISESDAFSLARIFFYFDKVDGLSLSIGAPSSPFLSNTVMYYFDCKVSDACEDAGITYTRYADDLCFSSERKNALWSMPKFVQGALLECDLDHVSVNPDKTIFVSHKENIHLTGLVITPEGKLSIGRSNKRKTKSLIYSYLNGSLSAENLAWLRGYLSFCMDVEPGFLDSLKSKYGEGPLGLIMSVNR